MAYPSISLDVHYKRKGTDFSPDGYEVRVSHSDVDSSHKVFKNYADAKRQAVFWSRHNGNALIHENFHGDKREYRASDIPPGDPSAINIPPNYP